MLSVLSFQAALRRVPEGRCRLLLGNGFSRACRNDIFAYDALFDRANFHKLSSPAQKAFEALGTTDFEVVMRALRSAAILVSLYGGEDAPLARQFGRDAEALKEVLVSAIADSHPARPSDIPLPAYRAARAFLNNFESIYTVNYDLLLYWALMQEELPPAELGGDDGFRTPESGKAEYVTWEIENTASQTVFYLHGALHVFDAGAELQKYTWVNTGIALIDQIRDALGRNYYPLFVAEGESRQKLARIKHSDYLSRSYRSFAQIGGTLFVYGHSFAANDEHVLRLIERGKLNRLFVGLYGDPDSDTNKCIVTRALTMPAKRPARRPLSVEFFDAATAKVWG
jgi:hypothetical protein